MDIQFCPIVVIDIACCCALWSLLQVGKEFDALLIDVQAPSFSSGLPVFDVFKKDTLDVRHIILIIANMHVVYYGWSLKLWHKKH